MYMTVTLNFPELTTTVRRSLAIIGKRSVDADGNLLFKDVTLGSLEEPILQDFFKQAIIRLKMQTWQFSSATDDTSITLSFPSNHPTDNDTAIQDAFAAYCVSYALYSWLLIVAPRMAPKYQEDANLHLDSVITLAFSKKPPI